MARSLLGRTPRRAIRVRLFIAYTGFVPLCVVSFVDTESIAPSVEVEAHSLYEAGALALAEFRSSGVVPRIGPAIVLQIEVRRPATRHKLSVSTVEAWLASGSKNPSEQAVKVRLKEALG
jgi:hypothetical protein